MMLVIVYMGVCDVGVWDRRVLLDCGKRNPSTGFRGAEFVAKP